VVVRSRIGSTPAVADPEVWHLLGHRTVSEHPCTVRSAIEQLDRLDYSFLLFTEQVSGHEAVVYRRTDGRHGLLGCVSVDPADRAQPVVGPEAAVLSTASARQRLADSDDWFLFYRERAGQRGRVLYRRRDGTFALALPI
jgi:hypothetical protein